MSTKQNKRKNWIDFLRALAIIFVVIGHQLDGDVFYYLFTSPIKIPLFFAISGYLFTLRPSKEYSLKVLKTLIIPWILLACIPELFLTPFKGGYYYFLSFLYDLFSGNIHWFMPCYIIASILFYLLLCCTKNSKIILGGGIIGICNRSAPL